MKKLIIAGSTLYDVFFAYFLAKQGYTIHLFTGENTLGRDLSATLRPWFRGLADMPEKFEKDEFFHALLQSLYGNDIHFSELGEDGVFMPRDLKVFLYTQLKKIGIVFHFLQEPIGIAESAAAKGLVYATDEGTFFEEGEVLGTFLLQSSDEAWEGIRSSISIEFLKLESALVADFFAQHDDSLTEIRCNSDGRGYVTIALPEESVVQREIFPMKVIEEQLTNIAQFKSISQSGFADMIPARVGKDIFPLGTSEEFLQENSLENLF